jgi:hypothetical protein
MRLQPLKFIVQAVALELNDDGNVVGERVSEPVALYRPEDVIDFVQSFPERLAAAQTDSRTSLQPLPEKEAS